MSGRPGQQLGGIKPESGSVSKGKRKRTATKPYQAERRLNIPFRHPQSTQTAAMSHSPERISSYRRHFEDSSSSAYQVRVCSPSPTRRQSRHASSVYSARPGAVRVESVGRRTVSAARRSRVSAVG